jgi:hypothetical protein
MKDKEGSIHIGNGHHLTIQTSHLVQLNDHLMLFTGDGKSIELMVEIKADFEKIPSEYHNTLIQMMSARYGGVINCYDNTKPFERPKKSKRKWYQFWKTK